MSPMKANAKRIIRQDRDQSRDEDRHHKNEIGRDSKDPGGLFRDDLIFVEELPDVPIRLKDAGPSLALHDFLEPGEHTGVQGCEDQYKQDLQRVVGDCLGHDCVLWGCRDGRWSGSLRPGTLRVRRCRATSPMAGPCGPHLRQVWEELSAVSDEGSFPGRARVANSIANLTFQHRSARTATGPSASPLAIAAIRGVAFSMMLVLRNHSTTRPQRIEELT